MREGLGYTSRQRQRQQRKQKCFCSACNGYPVPYSTWARHRATLLHQQQAAVLEVARSKSSDVVNEPLHTPGPIVDEDTPIAEDFLRQRSKERQQVERAQGKLLRIRQEIQRLRDICAELPPSLVFLQHPESKNSPTGSSGGDVQPGGVPDDKLILDPDSRINRGFLYAESTAYHLKRRLADINPRKDSWLLELQGYLEEQLVDLRHGFDRHKTEIWESQALRRSHQLACGARVVDTARYFHSSVRNRTIIQIACWLAVVSISLFFTASRREADLVLQCLGTVIGVATTTLQMHGAGMVPINMAALYGQTYSLGTALSHFSLNPLTIPFASCPKCCKLHQINDGLFSELCTFQSITGEVCGEPLGKTIHLRTGKTIIRPIRTFEYQPIAEWIGRLMSRPGLEDIMDQVTTSSSIKPIARDIWDARFVHDLKREGRPFCLSKESEKGEARYLFGLAVDWFNAHHSGAAKKTWSIGAMYVVCYNLPPHLRYRQENICLLGVIPGPRKPSGDQIQHFLQPLVDDLLDLWDAGIWYTQTSLFPQGRLVRAALVTLICDLEASRPIGGFTGFNATRFCSYCFLHLHRIAAALTFSALPLRNSGNHRRDAETWLCATPWRRRSLEKDNGIRWTALLQLPYWDPVRCTVLDVMHNKFLGNLHRHIRDIWGQNIEVEGDDGSVPIHRATLPQADLTRARIILEKGGSDALTRLTPGLLEGLCWDLDLMGDLGPSPVKSAMVDALVNWVRHSSDQYLPRIRSKNDYKRVLNRHTEPSLDDKDDALFLATPSQEWVKLGIRRLVRACNRRLKPNEPQFRERNGQAQIPDLVEFLKTRATDLHLPDAEEELGPVGPADAAVPGGHPPESVVLGSNIMGEVYSDMKNTTLPSWMRAAPQSMGSTSHGKLSADQWRVACTIHYVMTLTRLWGPGSAASKANPRFLLMLDNYIHLVLATTIAARRSTTASRRARLLFHVEKYLSGLRELYPTFKISFNNHLSLHLANFLEDFGPPHSWWAFPFERFNGLLQRIKTNSRFGQLEHTVLMQFCQGANLRALLWHNLLPVEIHPLSKRIWETIMSSYGGTLLTDNSPCDPMGWQVILGKELDPNAIPAEERGLITLPRVIQCRKLIRNGTEIFQDYTSSSKNSTIRYWSPTEQEYVVGRIVRIFVKTPNGDDTQFLVRPLEKLAHFESRKDPYLRYPELGAKIYYDSFDTALKLVHLSEIEGHVAVCLFKDTENRFSRPCVTTLPLDRPAFPVHVLHTYIQDKR